MSAKFAPASVMNSTMIHCAPGENGSIELAVPKLREGSYFPDWLLQPRRRAEQAFVSVIAGTPVLDDEVTGELANGEVNVRIWIHPAYRKQGYGTAALRKSRSEMAAYFPAVNEGEPTACRDGLP